MGKIYITDRQEFIEWKRKYTTSDGKFYAISCDDNEPKSYPCILLEHEVLNKEYDDNDTYYDFVYLTDFIRDWDYLK